MQFITPYVHIPGDNATEIMARNGAIVGVTKTRAVWRFGMLPGSDSAKAFGVSTDVFFWYLTDKNGKILSEFVGFGCELPQRFRDVIDGEL